MIKNDVSYLSDFKVSYCLVMQDALHLEATVKLKRHLEGKLLPTPIGKKNVVSQ